MTTRRLIARTLVHGSSFEAYQLAKRVDELDFYRWSYLMIFGAYGWRPIEY